MSETLIILQDSYSYVRSTAPAVAYDSKQYYQQPTATAAVAAAQPQPSVADTYYQTGTLKYTFFYPITTKCIDLQSFWLLAYFTAKKLCPYLIFCFPSPPPGRWPDLPQSGSAGDFFLFPFHCHQVFAHRGWAAYWAFSLILQDVIKGIEVTVKNWCYTSKKNLNF